MQARHMPLLSGKVWSISAKAAPLMGCDRSDTCSQESADPHRDKGEPLGLTCLVVGRLPVGLGATWFRSVASGLTKVN